MTFCVQPIVCSFLHLTAPPFTRFLSFVRCARKFLPEDVIAHEIEAAAKNDLDTLDWPKTSGQAKLKATASNGGLSKNKLLSKVSMWDEKVRDEVTKKAEQQAAEALITHNKRVSSGVNGSRFSPSKHGPESLNTGSPSKDNDGSSDGSPKKMDASTAHMVMMNPGNDSDRLREALEVIKLLGFGMRCPSGPILGNPKWLDQNALHVCFFASHLHYFCNRNEMKCNRRHLQLPRCTQVLKEERESASHLAAVEDKAEAKISFGGLVSGNRFKQNNFEQMQRVRTFDSSLPK